MLDVKEHVRGDRKVTFVEARGHQLWYVTELGFRFPVPMDDMGEATFARTDRAMLFMRYIRRHAEFLRDEGEDDVTFVEARAGNLWYVDVDGGRFPVPFGAIGPETFSERGSADRFEPFRSAHREMLERERQAIPAAP